VLALRGNGGFLIARFFTVRRAEYTSLQAVRRGKRLMGTLSEERVKNVKYCEKTRFFSGIMKKNVYNLKNTGFLGR